MSFIGLFYLCSFATEEGLCAHHLLPARLGQQLQTGGGPKALPGWKTLLQLLFSYWMLFWLMVTFPWESIAWFKGGGGWQGRGAWSPSRGSWLCFGWDLWKTWFSLPPLPQYALDDQVTILTVGNAGQNRQLQNHCESKKGEKITLKK